MTQTAYPVARAVASTLHDHFRQHRDNAGPALQQQAAALLPGPGVIESIIEAAFWSSLSA